jgi:hypothetical protein
LEVTSKKHELLTGDLIQKVETPRACEDGQPRILICFDQHATESIASAPLENTSKSYFKQLLIYFFGKRNQQFSARLSPVFTAVAVDAVAFATYFISCCCCHLKKNTRRTEHL